MEYSLLAALFGCYMAGATSNCCRLGARSVNTAQPCTSLQCRLIRSHIRSVYRCLAVPCHLHFWQNDRDLLGDTAVTRGWTGYRNKSQHIKMTPEKKNHPPLRPGLESATFRPRVRQTATVAVVATIGTFHKAEAATLGTYSWCRKCSSWRKQALAHRTETVAIQALTHS